MIPLIPRIPASTYRLQFHAGFTFDAATEILEYLDALGISDVYASPFFQASPESTHGYDVANQNNFNPVVGDAGSFRNFASELRRRDMGLVLDFVPNHMGISESLNLWWMEVLEEGVSSKYAHYFDIDWHPEKEALSEKVMLPILGERYGITLESGELKLVFEQGAFSLKYHETKLPINPKSYFIILNRVLPHLSGEKQTRLRDCIESFATLDKSEAKEKLASFVAQFPDVAGVVGKIIEEFQGKAGEAKSFDGMHELLEKQAYRLCYWRMAAEEINYRRFFDINTLAAIRVEVPEVFEASHQLLFELLDRGDVTGLRIDHIDGLWNPREYLFRLQERYAQLKQSPTTRMGLYLVVEKILDAEHEQLPEDWPVHGTTGYEFTNHIAHLFTDSSSERKLTHAYQHFTQNTECFSDLVYEKKLLVMDYSFASELNALGRELAQLSELNRHNRDFTLNLLVKALRGVIGSFSVYRTYTTEYGINAERDERMILRAVSLARHRNPSIDKPVFDFIRNLLLLRFPEGTSDVEKERYTRFVMKFQQCTSPVMAKGLEDTALYLYHRLTALNEVGGNPESFGLNVPDFHLINAKFFEKSPHRMLATSTHDTKRSEDVRMRLAALSEMPDEWRRSLHRWARMNRKFCKTIDEETAPSANEQYLLYQTLVGTWPLEEMTPESRISYTNRIQEYMTKALKEGKVHSSWTEPNEPWEEAINTYVEKILDEKAGAAFQQNFMPFFEKIASAGAWNSLSEVVLKCTVPGVPDIYQGTDLWDFSLVDPDNRRPVNYELRRQHLESLSESSIEELVADWKSGRIKLRILQSLLKFRRDHTEFFLAADYQPLEIQGSNARNGIAFLRCHGKCRLLVATCRFTTSLGASPMGDAWKGNSISTDDFFGIWKNVLTGENVLLENPEIQLSELFKQLPMSVLYQSNPNP